MFPPVAHFPDSILYATQDCVFPRGMIKYEHGLKRANPVEVGERTMANELVILHEKPIATHMIAGWRRQWSDGGEISGGLTRYLVRRSNAKQIGEMSPEVSKMCYPFQVPGTHDTYRPRVAYEDGLPVKEMHRENIFYDAGNGLIIFRGEEPWFRIDIYGEAFFAAVKGLGVRETVAVEGYNGAAPPDMERSVNCVYSQPHMKQELEKYGLSFSSYGSQSRNGPTVGMALITMAHELHPDLNMFRLGAMSPMFPFLTSSNQPVGITRDHRSFYDIMRRLKSMFNLDIDLAELMTLADTECREMQETLERISSSNPQAKEIIERARADYRYSPFLDPMELDPALERNLDDIIQNAPDSPTEPE